MDTLAMPWANARAAHLLAIRRIAPVKVGNDHEEGYNTNQDGFVMHTQKVETLEPTHLFMLLVLINNSLY